MRGDRITALAGIITLVTGALCADAAPLSVVRERGVFGVLLQYPGASGAVRDLRPVIERLGYTVD